MSLPTCNDTVRPFTPDDLRLGCPRHVLQTYAMFCRELDRKRGMIHDLNQLAEDNCGLSPEDCSLLTDSVVDRNNFLAALTAMRELYGP